MKESMNPITLYSSEMTEKQTGINSLEYKLVIMVRNTMYTCKPALCHKNNQKSFK